ncbi:pali-domain-containing protein [Tilletiaria anomala UBC 951]|uniref:Pali-domain-containing protein n=1 Tax=Tilletiaria anomala (strain ATCC 24038 / CBS 436.72 / UBC 951) TaxID=1037660 RepID=A0A066VXA7_TILAU|nr:pali-domain-containing protein [Tilletiaria anomala UBC 951]KDN44903.1 pali-domain-containing protein [Tilletiaria anomala UBC 951]
MVRRSCCIPGVVLSFLGMALLLLCTVSTPLAWGSNSNIGFVQSGDLLNDAGEGLIDYTDGSNTNRQIQYITFGTYGYCTKGVGESSYRFCNNLGSAYAVYLRPSGNETTAAYSQTEIKSSWTRGLVLHIVAFVIAVIALVLACVPNMMILLISSLAHLLAALFALIAFIIDIVLFVYSRNRIQQVAPGASVYPWIGFYCALISIPLLVLAGITVCCGRREKGDDFTASSSKRSGIDFGGMFKRKNRADVNEGGVLLSSRQKVLEAFEDSRA